MFADDINLHMSASNIRRMQRKVEDELQNIDYRNKKTNCLLITTKPIALYSMVKIE